MSSAILEADGSVSMSVRDPRGRETPQGGSNMTMCVQIRAFVMDDYDAVTGLWARFPGAIGLGRSDTREQIEKKLSRDPDLFLVAEDAGAIVGTVIGGFDGRRGLIYHLAADPSPTYCGLGRILMAEVERRLAAKGCLRAYLLVLPENVRLLDYYTHLGWQAMRITTMAKDLGACAPSYLGGHRDEEDRPDPC